ncbi:hypothetical protein QUF80_15470 [Desulfococcaceae bacterium HSG8]|nr:hypothetical protein [Desulfococcaceae bacterium HSG8]
MNTDYYFRGRDPGFCGMERIGQFGKTPGFSGPFFAGISRCCSRGIDKSHAAGSDLSIRTGQERGRFHGMTVR